MNDIQSRSAVADFPIAPQGVGAALSTLLAAVVAWLALLLVTKEPGSLGTGTLILLPGLGAGLWLSRIASSSGDRELPSAGAGPSRRGRAAAIQRGLIFGAVLNALGLAVVVVFTALAKPNAVAVGVYPAILIFLAAWQALSVRDLLRLERATGFVVFRRVDAKRWQWSRKDSSDSLIAVELSNASA